MPFTNRVVRGTLIISILPLPSELGIYYFVFILMKRSLKQNKIKQKNRWLLFIFEKEMKPNMQEVMTIPPQRGMCQATLAKPCTWGLSFKGRVLTVLIK